MSCPDCEGEMMDIEYHYGHPDRYDGVSESYCPNCGLRIGRWSRKKLGFREFEPRHGVRQ